MNNRTKKTLKISDSVRKRTSCVEKTSVKIYMNMLCQDWKLQSIILKCQNIQEHYSSHNSILAIFFKHLKANYIVFTFKIPYYSLLSFSYKYDSY